MKTILYIEDDEKIRTSVLLFLRQRGFQAFGRSSAQEGMDFILQNTIDCVLLDLGLPDFSGEDLCLWIKENTTLPVIMLTAKVDEDCVVHGLQLGANDYIRKPFGLKELFARIQLVLNQQKKSPSLSFNQGKLLIQLENHQVFVCGKEIHLTKNEFKILGLLAQNNKKIYSRENLIEGAFGFHYEGYERTVDSHIKNLRSKIESNPKSPEFILTAHGIGYQFVGVLDEVE